MDVCDPPIVCVDTDGSYECACGTVLEPLGGYYNQQVDEYTNVCISEYKNGVYNVIVILVRFSVDITTSKLTNTTAFV